MASAFSGLAGVSIGSYLTFPTEAVIGDFNKDGYSDVSLFDKADRVTTFFGQEDGSLMTLNEMGQRMRDELKTQMDRIRKSTLETSVKSKTTQGLELEKLENK